jgi:hypothetical protein
MTQFGFPAETARHSVQLREHNQLTTCYFLLEAKKLREHQQLQSAPASAPKTTKDSGATASADARVHSSKDHCVLL